MKPLRERNQAAVGAIALVVVLIALGMSYFSQELPVIGSGTTYTAKFKESAGIKADNEVRLAGVKVGEVTDVSLDGNEVEVSFRMDDGRLRDRSRASIEIKTLLGEKYLALEQDGPGEQDSGEPIPAERTRSPFDVTQALDQLSNTADQIDTDQLAQSFRVVSDTFGNSPPEMQGALNGLSQLSQTISSRDQELANLLSNTKQVSKVAADRDAQVQRLFSDGNKLLAELQHRKAAIDKLLVGTEHLATQLHGVVDDNQQQLTPALQRLQGVTEILHRNQDNLSRGLREMAPFVRNFNNTLGNGRWFDGYLCGFIPPSSLGVPIGLNPEGCPPPDNRSLGDGTR